VADHIGVRMGEVELLQGERSRDKVVLVHGASIDSLATALVG
jgi:uncharacterized protein YggU (UPF0235/DUF167 family)